MTEESVLAERLPLERLPVDRAAAFRRLVDGQLHASYRLASVLLGDPVEAEDATHDAVETAWRSWSALRDPDRFEAWFQRILVNRCHDRLRRRRVRPLAVALAHDPATPDHAARSAELDALDQALRALSAEHRLVIVLRYFQDLSVDEVAQRTGIRPGTVKSRLHHALRALRAAYEAGARPVTKEVTR